MTALQRNDDMVATAAQAILCTPTYTWRLAVIVTCHGRLSRILLCEAPDEDDVCTAAECCQDGNMSRQVLTSALPMPLPIQAVALITCD